MIHVIAGWWKCLFGINNSLPIQTNKFPFPTFRCKMNGHHWKYGMFWLPKKHTCTSCKRKTNRISYSTYEDSHDTEWAHRYVRWLVHKCMSLSPLVKWTVVHLLYSSLDRWSAYGYSLGCRSITIYTGHYLAWGASQQPAEGGNSTGHNHHISQLKGNAGTLAPTHRSERERDWNEEGKREG